MRLKDKVVIVTGGANGIGQGAALLFAEEGAAVFLTDIQAEAGEATVRQITEQGGEATFLQADVSQEADCQRVVAACRQAYGRVNVLVNNAAIFVLKGVEATPEDWKAILETNVCGYAYMMRFAAEEMRAVGGGSIVNVASVSSVIGQAGMLTYNATKGAVLQMTRCAAIDLAPDNIRVNCVCPGLVWTSQVEKLSATMGWTKAQAEAEIGAQQIMKRAAAPREIAYPMLFLASDESSFCTGSALFADGGWTVQ